jgi:hypothetical protein
VLLGPQESVTRGIDILVSDGAVAAESLAEALAALPPDDLSPDLPAVKAPDAKRTSPW